MYMADIASIPADLAGLPAISIPCGFGENNLPIGLQITGAQLHDVQILKAAHLFEKATDYTKKCCPMLKEAL